MSQSTKEEILSNSQSESRYNSSPATNLSISYFTVIYTCHDDNPFSFDLINITNNFEKSFNTKSKLLTFCIWKSGSTMNCTMSMAAQHPINVSHSLLQAKVSQVYLQNGWDLMLVAPGRLLYYNLIYLNANLCTILPLLINNKNVYEYKCLIDNNNNVRISLCMWQDIKNTDLNPEKFFPITASQYYDNFKMYLQDKILVTNQKQNRQCILQYKCLMCHIDYLYDSFDRTGILSIENITNSASSQLLVHLY
ncbi:MAG TPA: hypothetical protein VJ201_06750 [Candidatus Babeliales bacterium]|nr:hypothetical protein [Candidatus Babeliales bacterium]